MKIVKCRICGKIKKTSAKKYFRCCMTLQDIKSSLLSDVTVWTKAEKLKNRKNKRKTLKLNNTVENFNKAKPYIKRVIPIVEKITAKVKGKTTSKIVAKVLNSVVE